MRSHQREATETARPAPSQTIPAQKTFAQLAARTAPVEAAFTQLSVREHATVRDFAARWHDLLKWPQFDEARQPAPMIGTAGEHAARNAQGRTSSTRLLIEAGDDGTQDSASEPSWSSVSFAVALAM